MVHTVKRFSDPSKISTIIALRYVISGFYSSPDEFNNNFENFIKKNFISQKNYLLNIDKDAQQEHSRTAHVQLYHLYHKEILKNIEQLVTKLNNHPLCFVNVFSVSENSNPEKIGEHIKVELTKTAGPKKGHSIFSAMNLLSNCIENIELEYTSNKQQVIYVPLGPIMTFATFSEEKHKLVNALDTILGSDNNILLNVNNILGEKHKQLITGFEKFKNVLMEELYLVHPTIYDSDLANKLFAKIPDDEKRNSYYCQYNRVLTAFMWYNLIDKLVAHQTLWYYGEETSPIKSILKTIATATGKLIRANKTMENTYCPVGGSTDPSAQSKLNGARHTEDYQSSKLEDLTSKDILTIDKRFWSSDENLTQD